MIEQTGRGKCAVILFSKLPCGIEVKSRLGELISAREKALLMGAFLDDLTLECRKTGFDIILAYCGEVNDNNRRYLAGCKYSFPQAGDSLEAKMAQAFQEGFARGYDRLLLIGTDIPEIRAEDLRVAAALLDTRDIVLGPSADGGYYLVGMKVFHREVFGLDTDRKLDGFEQLTAHLRVRGFSLGFTESKADIDRPEDLFGLRQRLIYGAQNVGAGHPQPSELAVDGVQNVDGAHPQPSGLAVDGAQNVDGAHPQPSGLAVDGAQDLGAQRPQAPERLVNTRRALECIPLVSVIIPVYNEERGIDALLAQLEAVREKCELIFVDGGSEDSTRERISERGFRVLDSPKGRGRQLNRGAACARGNIFFFLHCDSCLPGDFLAELIEALREAELGYFGMKFDDDSLLMRICAGMSARRARRGIVFGDQGIFVRRALFEALGGFKELPLMEDYQFSLDIKERGLVWRQTARPLITSARRYPKGSLGRLSLMYHMFSLRRKYCRGEPIEKIAAAYGEKR